jgi:hypothetical protein
MTCREIAVLAVLAAVPVIAAIAVIAVLAVIANVLKVLAAMLSHHGVSFTHVIYSARLEFDVVLIGI